MGEFLIPALLIGGAALSFSSAGGGCCNTGSGYSSYGAYAHTPCSGASVRPASNLGYAGGYRYAAGFAPTPAYVFESQHYGFNGMYAVGYGGMPVTHTSRYSDASTYYYD